MATKDKLNLGLGNNFFYRDRANEVKKFQKQFDYWHFYYCNCYFISILIK